MPRADDVCDTVDGRQWGAATDGDLLGGGKVDEFRIKIWDDSEVIYDNKSDLGDEADGGTMLGGGNIVIHKARTK